MHVVGKDATCFAVGWPARHHDTNVISWSGRKPTPSSPPPLIPEGDSAWHNVYLLYNRA
jgi:hypothetical protein